MSDERTGRWWRMGDCRGTASQGALASLSAGFAWCLARASRGNDTQVDQVMSDERGGRRAVQVGAARRGQRVSGGMRRTR